VVWTIPSPLPIRGLVAARLVSTASGIASGLGSGLDTDALIVTNASVVSLHLSVLGD
jgi:hypothetical protein